LSPSSFSKTTSAPRSFTSATIRFANRVSNQRMTNGSAIGASEVRIQTDLTRV
jgi:hypothetical protein